jgi:hypothetical protein
MYSTVFAASPLPVGEGLGVGLTRVQLMHNRGSAVKNLEGFTPLDKEQKLVPQITF